VGSFGNTAKQIRCDDQIKIMFELLLLDPNTPEKVYKELFGVDMEFVAKYKKDYTGLWDTPRIFLFQKLSKIKDKNLRNSALKVYNVGWEALDALFNRGSNINPGETAMRLIKISAARAVHEAIQGKKVDMQLINAAKNMVGATRDYSSIDESITSEDWEIMISEIQEKEKHAIVDGRVLDALDQVMDNTENNILFKKYDEMTDEERKEAKVIYVRRIAELDKKEKEVKGEKE